MRRWWTIALAVSVALNLFFVGIAVARFWQHRQGRPDERRGDAALLGPGAPGNPARPEGRRGPRRRDPLSWMTEEERGALRPQRQALVGKRHEAEQVLSSEPFDVAKFRAALEGVRAQTAQIQSSVHERLLERAQRLGPEERKQLAEVSWGSPGERGKPGRHHD